MHFANSADKNCSKNLGKWPKQPIFLAKNVPKAFKKSFQIFYKNFELPMYIACLYSELFVSTNLSKVCCLETSYFLLSRDLILKKKTS